MSLRADLTNCGALVPAKQLVCVLRQRLKIVYTQHLNLLSGPQPDAAGCTVAMTSNADFRVWTEAVSKAMPTSAGGDIRHMLLITLDCCCRHAELPQQASGLGSSCTVPSESVSHPLADTASHYQPVQPASDDVTSSCGGGDQPGSSRQPVSLSEELLDLFESIQQLQQEVVALPQPQQIPAATQPGPSGNQVLHPHACMHSSTCLRSGMGYVQVQQCMFV